LAYLLARLSLVDMASQTSNRIDFSNFVLDVNLFFVNPIFDHSSGAQTKVGSIQASRPKTENIIAVITTEDGFAPSLRDSVSLAWVCPPHAEARGY
jgi:hypothetical protein